MDQKILDALKTINDKLGGTNDPNENWGSLLQEIAQNVGSGGGGGALMVNATYSSDTEMMTLDKTFGEISAAIVAGQTCFVHVPETAGNIFAGYYAVTSLWINQGGDGTVGMLYNSNGTPLYINFDANASDEYPSKYLGE